MAGSPIEPCSTTPQFVTASLSIGTPITWTGTIYTDTLGAGSFGAAFNVVPGSVAVTVNGIDRTADVTVTLGPPLRIRFDNIGTVSNTANISVTYQVTAGSGTTDGETYIFRQFTSGEQPRPRLRRQQHGGLGFLREGEPRHVERVRRAGHD